MWFLNRQWPVSCLQTRHVRELSAKAVMFGHFAVLVSQQMTNCGDAIISSQFLMEACLRWVAIGSLPWLCSQMVPWYQPPRPLTVPSPVVTFSNQVHVLCWCQSPSRRSFEPRLERGTAAGSITLGGSELCKPWGAAAVVAITARRATLHRRWEIRHPCTRQEESNNCKLCKVARNGVWLLQRYLASSLSCIFILFDLQPLMLGIDFYECSCFMYDLLSL